VVDKEKVWGEEVRESCTRRRPFGPEAAARLTVTGAVKRVKMIGRESRDVGEPCDWWMSRDVAEARDWREVT
jgi:hypothetical protein